MRFYDSLGSNLNIGENKYITSKDRMIEINFSLDQITPIQVLNVESSALDC